MNLSIIVPLYNEEASVLALYHAITATLKPLSLEAEILFVDDGSVDKTFEKAEALARQDPRLRVIRFRKNYGQTAAMAAGIDYANGEILITMDGDLQNDPADIPKFLAKIRDGYDVVVGWRHDRQDKLITRKIPSKVANWLIGKITGVPIKDNGCSLKAYRAHIIKTIPLYSEMHRFIPAMTSLAGAGVAEIKVRHHPRRYGVSKYGLSRIYKVLLDLLIVKTIASFAARPLLWFGILALPAALIAAIAFLGSLYQVIAGSPTFSVVAASVGVLFTALVCFLLLGGVLGELIYKTGNLKVHNFALVTAQYPSTDRKQSKILKS